jgi:anti-sigma B factor antagonist
MKIVKKIIDNSIIVLDITGEVKMGESAERLSAELSKLLGDPQVEGVILDLENINYMDSTGLGEMVGYLSRFQDSGKRLKLVNPNITVVKLLQLTKLDQVFKTYGSEEEALEEMFQ